MFDGWYARRRSRKLQEEAIRYAANGWPVVPLALPWAGYCPCGGGCLDPHPYGDVVRNAFLAEAAWAKLPSRYAGTPSRRLGTSGLSRPGRHGNKLDGEELGGRGWSSWDRGESVAPRSRAESGAHGVPGPEAGTGAHGVPSSQAETSEPRLASRARAGWAIGLVTEEFDVVELPAEYGALLNHRLKDTCPTAMAPLRRRWWFFLVPGSIPAAQVASVGGVLRSGPHEWVPAPGTRLETTGRIRWLVHPYLTGWRPYERCDPIDQVFR